MEGNDIQVDTQSPSRQKKGKAIFLGILFCVTVGVILAIAIPLSIKKNDDNKVAANPEQQQQQNFTEQRCMDTDGITGTHKSSPSPETELNNCKAFEGNSCCTPDTVSQNAAITSTSIGKPEYDWSMCGDMSPECQKYLQNEICFYFCSPNVYPFTVPITKSVQEDGNAAMENEGETYVQVPICTSYCDDFYSACKDDSICVESWYEGWDVTVDSKTGITYKQCRADSTCDTFGNRFVNGTDMCNSIYGDSYVATPGSPGVDCLVMSFEDSEKNPNDAVAAMFANEG